MQGILYLEREPKFAVEAPTPTANTIAKIKHISSLGSLKINLNGLTTPNLKNKLVVSNKKVNASIADSTAAAELISQGNGLKKVATILFRINKTGLDALIL